MACLIRARSVVKLVAGAPTPMPATAIRSDACAVEAAPALRQTPQGRAIAFDDIMDALRILDREAAEYPKPPPHYRRVLANRVAGVFGRKSRGTKSNDRQGSIN